MFVSAQCNEANSLMGHSCVLHPLLSPFLFCLWLTSATARQVRAHFFSLCARSVCRQRVAHFSVRAGKSCVFFFSLKEGAKIGEAGRIKGAVADMLYVYRFLKIVLVFIVYIILHKRAENEYTQVCFGLPVCCFSPFFFLSPGTALRGSR